MSAQVPHSSVQGDGRAAAPRPRVVIVGVGHAGLEAAKALRKAPVDVTLVDRRNYHKFQPLLYQVATAGLQPGDVTQPARHIFRRQRNLAFRPATVTGVDFAARRVHVEEGEPIPYDYLLLGAGASTAYYGVEGAEAHGFPLKNVADAVNLRSHVLLQFEEANRDPSLIEAGALTFVVVGGGPTGVEMAGALRELFDKVLRKDFPGLDVRRARVILVEAADTLLASYEPRQPRRAPRACDPGRGCRHPPGQLRAEAARLHAPDARTARRRGAAERGRRRGDAGGGAAQERRDEPDAAARLGCRRPRQPPRRPPRARADPRRARRRGRDAPRAGAPRGLRGRRHGGGHG